MIDSLISMPTASAEHELGKLRAAAGISPSECLVVVIALGIDCANAHPGTNFERCFVRTSCELLQNHGALGAREVRCAVCGWFSAEQQHSVITAVEALQCELRPS